VLNRSAWPSVVFDACSGNESASSPSAVEDVEGMPPKGDEIVESNRSAVGSVWLGYGGTYIDAAFDLAVASVVAETETDSTVVSPAPMVVV